MSETICTTCARCRDGKCDGEKNLTACNSYQKTTTALSDYIKLMGLLSEYKTELDKRLSGYPDRMWTENGFVTVQYRPRNKSRLSRLRLEISRLMLQMERKMTDYSLMDKKEGWE